MTPPKSSYARSGDSVSYWLMLHCRTAATQLELYGDPPPATQRPFEMFGPPAPPEEDQVTMPDPENDLEAKVEGRPPVGH